MEFGEIFKNALRYPISNPQMLVMVGVLFLIASLTLVLAQFGVYNDTFSFVWSIITLIILIFIVGYSISVLKNGIELNDEIPAFNWAGNLVDGIKAIVVTIIYMIIPTIICGIIGAVSMGPAISKIFSPANMNQLANSTSNINVFVNSIPIELWNSLFAGITITAIVAVILFFIFGIFNQIALCRLAKYDSIGEAFSFGKIFENIKEIGFLRLIGFLIVLYFISFILAFIIGLLMVIPYVGVIIACLIGNSFILLFTNRALGLLYSDI